MWSRSMAIALTFASAASFAPRTVARSSGHLSAASVFDITVDDTNGKPVKLEKYRSKKALLFVNVASKWGLTATNYQELAQLYEKYSDKGLEILAMPCNQFGGQEPGTNAEVLAFARSKGAKFPVFAKLDVNGENTHPLYQFLKANAPGGFLGSLLGKDIKWNFAKYLVRGSDGKVVKSYEPPQSPLSIEPDILDLLK